MQENPHWYTPTTSALHNQQTDNSNYFYNYSQSWDRTVNGYHQQEYYNRSGQYSMNMRTCNENQVFGSDHGNYQCPPMYFRQDTAHSDASSNTIRPRADRGSVCNQNGVNLHCGQSAPNNSRIKPPRCITKPSDSEAENFSSVFTQSLTSLYSQDTEANFEEKTFKCDPDAPANDSELTTCTRPKTEDVPSNCNSDYSFNAFNTGIEEHHPGMGTFANLKIKQEFPDMEMENPMQYGNYSLDDSYLKRHRSLAEAYSRKRKRASVPSMSYRTQGGGDNVDTKAVDIYHSQSQWIPNAVQACSTNGSSSTDTYQTDFSSTSQSANYDAFENIRGFKRQSVKPRGSRGRAASKGTRVQNAIKRIPKKVSPLTLYAKVHDDRILEVTCRRYKKRTKPANSEDGFGSQNDNGFQRINEPWESTYNSVGKVVQSLVDKVAALYMPKRTIDLTRISQGKAKELLFRFCSDYALDYRDFQDFNEILSIHVTNESEENVTRNRKKRRITEREETNTRKIEKINELEEGIHESEKKRDGSTKKESSDKNTEKSVEKNTESKPPPKQERKVGRPKKQHVVQEEQQRVLRNLPSRQPAKKVKKVKKTEPQVKNRYPKRKGTRSGRGGRGKKLKILIDISKEDSCPPEVLELESDSSRQTSASKTDKEDIVEDVEDDDDEIKKIDKYEEENEEQASDEAQESPPPKCPSEDENEKEEQPKAEVSATDEEYIIKELERETSEGECHDISESRCPSPEIKDLVDMLKKIKKEVDDEETRLRQPPQLVCMAPEDRNIAKSDPSQEKNTKDSTKVSSNGRASPAYPDDSGVQDVEDADTPSPPKLKKTYSSKYHRSMSSESNTNDSMAIDSDDSDGPDDKLVIDMDPPEPPQETPDTDPEKEVTVEAEDLKVSKPNETAVKVDETAPTKESSSSSDECVSQNPQTETAVEIVDVIINETPTLRADKHSLLKEKLLEKPIFKKVEHELMEMQKAAMSANNGNSPSRTDRVDQDESILRTLLLETEVIASTSSADGTSPSTSGVMDLTAHDATPDIDFLEHIESEISQLPNFPIDLPIGLIEAMRLLNGQPFPHINNSSSATNDDSQNQNGALPPELTQDDSIEPIPKDSKELQENIKKLKNEIFNLQMMSDQKEKERVAIICYKRYKEEILKRNYRAFVYIAQDEIRYWIDYQRKKASLSRIATGMPSNTHNAHRNEDFNISEAARLIVESLKALDIYPTPAPAHSSTNHRPQSIHSPQSLPKTHRNPQQTGEKVSAVETMVAKATENYGLDMRNFRDGLRATPDAPVVSGTILQKALSSSSSQNSSPDQHRPWTPDKSHKKHSSTAKPLQPLASKPYTDSYGPLDMMMPRKEPPRKNPKNYRNSPDTSRSLKSFQGSGRSPTESLLPETVHLNGNHNPYASWNTQSGGRITSENSTTQSKPISTLLRQSIASSRQATTTNVESPLQRQLNSHKTVARPNFSIPSSLDASSYSQQSMIGERSSGSGERPSSRITDRPSSRITDRPSPRIADRPSSRISERSLAISSERPLSINSERPLSISSERPLSINSEGPLSINGERPLSINGETSLSVNGERSISTNGEHLPNKKPNADRRQHTFGSTPLSSNSTMPYGGHIIRSNTSPLTTTVSSMKTCVSATQGSSTSSPIPNSSTPPLCMGCSVSDAKFLCSGCRKHWYCSAACQSLRWPEHSRVCAGRMFLPSASSYS